MTGFEQLAEIAAPIVKTASTLIEKLAGKPCEIAGDMLADQMRIWQWQQRIRIFYRAEQLMAKEGIAARALPSSFLIPLLHAVGNIEDDELQTLWSNLIASAAESDDACEASFIEILKGLSPREARLMRLVASEKVVATSVLATTAESVAYSALKAEKLTSLGFTSSQQFWAAATRLQRIGVLVLEPVGHKSIRRKIIGDSGFSNDIEIAVGTKVRICFSRFGAMLFAMASRETVAAESVTDPWVGVSLVRRMAIEAGQAASGAISIDDVENRIEQNFNNRLGSV